MLKISKVLILQVAKEIQWEVTQLKVILIIIKIKLYCVCLFRWKNQFEGDYSSTEEFDKIIIKNPKTVSEIKRREK